MDEYKTPPAASTKAKRKYNAKAYDRLYPFVKKGEKEKIEQAAAAVGESLNDYIVKAIRQRMEQEGAYLTEGQQDSEG
jgi:Protein of unknown function (DUF1778).